MPINATEIKRIMANVQASLAVEGLKPGRKAKMISQKYLEGKLSSEEAVSMIIKYHTDKKQSK